MIEIQLSDPAKKELRRLLQPDQTKCVRLVFKGVGWKGSKFAVTLDEFKEGDGKITVDGIEIIFNRKEKLYVHKSIVHYEESNLGNGFDVQPWFAGFQ